MKIRFECQGSGKCCVSRGEYGFVYVTVEDRRRFARHLKISTQSFTKQYCQRTDGFWHLKDNQKTGNCIFLKAQSCSAYRARPTQCRTWPFWPEVMNAKTWSKEVASFCPGVGKGKLWSAKEIEKQKHLQETSEAQLDKEALRRS